MLIVVYCILIATRHFNIVCNKIIAKGTKLMGPLQLSIWYRILLKEIIVSNQPHSLPSVYYPDGNKNTTKSPMQLAHSRIVKSHIIV